MPHHSSRQPAGVQNSFSETWNRLTPTLKGALEGKRARFTTYCHLWHLCGGRPGPIAVTAKDVAAALNIDERTARGDLDGLRDVRLVDFHDRDRETGVYALYVCSPEEPGQVRSIEADPQAELFEAPADAIAPPEPPEIVAGVFAQIPPRAESPTGLLAQKPPRSGQRSLWDSENSTVANTPAGLLAQKPTMDHGTIEDGAIGSAVLDELKIETLSPAETKTATAATTFSGHPTLAGMAEREALEKLEQLRGRRNEGSPPDDPAEGFATQKARIVDRLVEWAEEFYPHTQRRMDRRRAGQIADHVLLDHPQLGLSEAELCGWLDEIRRWFLDGKFINGKLIENPAGMLDARLEKLLAERGVPTRAKSKREAKRRPK